MGPEANTWLQAVKEFRPSFFRLNRGGPKALGFLKKARKARRLERAFSCRIPEEVYDKLEGELAQDE